MKSERYRRSAEQGKCTNPTDGFAAVSQRLAEKHKQYKRKSDCLYRQIGCGKETANQALAYRHGGCAQVSVVVDVTQTVLADRLCAPMFVHMEEACRKYRQIDCKQQARDMLSTDVCVHSQFQSLCKDILK